MTRPDPDGGTGRSGRPTTTSKPDLNTSDQVTPKTYLTSHYVNEKYLTAVRLVTMGSGRSGGDKAARSGRPRSSDPCRTRLFVGISPKSKHDLKPREVLGDHTP